jgi:Leucine-rich repeat (LRR) protein
LEKLMSLNLANNSIGDLPNSMQRMQQLQELNVSQNALTDFPPYFSGVSSLTDLDLSGNKFTEDKRNSLRSTYPNAKL